MFTDGSMDALAISGLEKLPARFCPRMYMYAKAHELTQKNLHANLEIFIFLKSWEDILQKCFIIASLKPLV